MKVLFDLVFIIAGLSVFEWGLRAIRNRAQVTEQFCSYGNWSRIRWFLRIWTFMTISTGILFVTSAITVWFSPLGAVSLIVLPLAVSVTLVVIGRLFAPLS